MSDHPVADDVEPVIMPLEARELFAELDAVHTVRVAAELREVEVVHRLCLAFDTVDEDAFGEAAERLMHYGAHGTPPVAEFLSLEIAALLGMSPASGAELIGGVLDCVYRHPVMWNAVQAGAVRWYRAIEVINHVNAAGLSQEAAQWIDQRIAPLLQTLPRGRANRKLRGLIALADPALARDRERKAREHRHVTIWTPQLEAGGTCLIAGRIDPADANALDQTLTRLADTLATLGNADPIDLRRATALGILADPQRALTLLTEAADPGSSRTATVILHVTDQSLADVALIGRVDGHGPLSRETWTELLGHDRITIRPILDLNAITPVDAYEIPDRIRTAVTHRSPIDTAPYGTQSAAHCDLDHTIPYDHSRGRPPGQTRIDNLAPVNRKMHRAKTARTWRLTQYEGGWLEWLSPAGYRYATGPYGTLRLADAG